MLTIDFMQPPIKVEARLIEKQINADKAKEHYLSCRDVLLKWCGLIGQDVGECSKHPLF
ncbi:hypothetical protein [Photobacterium sp. TY1-4]|uniref:hypothetical protein n=1 Tax=Photobacterium sp. TY1-4 TaxID=2899122 RepID=UPI0021C19704|nr:hypothetical protein [Photobacterium sp. TY1-4]UXH99937.1 hypothetical protein NH461_08810 [Photobacterium sp. TY1-4]